MSVYTTVFAGTSPIGGLFVGALAANAGAAAAIAWGGGISAVAAVAGLVWYRRILSTSAGAPASKGVLAPAVVAATSLAGPPTSLAGPPASLAASPAALAASPAPSPRSVR